MKRRNACATERRPACLQNIIESWTACTSVLVWGHVGALLTNVNRCLRQISPPILIGPTTELAAKFGLGACCSTPVFSSEGALLGTVAMFFGIRTNPASMIES